MKSFSIHALVLALFCLVVTGCRTHTQTLTVGNGYEEVAHVVHTYIDEPPPPRLSFQYRSADGKVTPVWPSLSGPKEAIYGNLAFFVGDTTRRDGGAFITQPRLFAVQVPQPPVDINDEVLWLWAKSAGKSFDTAAARLSVLAPHAADDGLTVHFEFIADNGFIEDKNWPDTANYRMNWAQVTNLVHDVAAKATLRKDAHLHVYYLKAKF